MPSTPDFSGSNPRIDTPLIYIGEADEPGVYLDWDRSGRAGVETYEILRADHIDGDYSQVGEVDFPTCEFVDELGRPECYYRIKELDAQGAELGLSQPLIGEELLVRASLRFGLKEFLRRPVHKERAQLLDDRRTRAKFSFDSWAYWPRPTIRINASDEGGARDPWRILSEDEPLTTTWDEGVDPDYPDGLRYRLDYQGRIYFIQGATDDLASLAQHSFVEADYAVRLFTCQEMNSALNMALQQLNCLAGTTTYNCVESTPPYYETALVTGATYYLLRNLKLGLTTRQKRLLLTDPEADKPIEELADMLKMYQDDWKGIQETLPKRRYPRSLLIVTPQMQMPGGRQRYFRSLFKQDDYS